jgi:hypothetical protein
MAQKENKTLPTEVSIPEFLNTVADEQKRKDSFALVELMKQVTGLEPVMWGGSIIGFGMYHYKYASGREGDMCLTGFSPRKQSLTIYGMNDAEVFADLLKQLGKYTISGGCLHIKRLEQVDIPTLKSLIEASYKRAQEQHAKTPE